MEDSEYDAHEDLGNLSDARTRYRTGFDWDRDRGCRGGVLDHRRWCRSSRHHDIDGGELAGPFRNEPYDNLRCSEGDHAAGCLEISNQPCEALSPPQLRELNLPSTGKPDLTSAIAKNVGPSCSWLNSEASNFVSVGLFLAIQMDLMTCTGP